MDALALHVDPGRFYSWTDNNYFKLCCRIYRAQYCTIKRGKQTQRPMPIGLVVHSASPTSLLVQ